VTRVERVRRFATGEKGADLLLWLAVCVPVFLADELPDPEQPAGLPLPWLTIVAVPSLTLAVLVARRMPLAAAAVPPALGLAATPELFTTNFVIGQVLLAYLLGRRAAGHRGPPLLFAAVGAAGVPLVLVMPSATVSEWFSLVANVLVTLLLPWLAGRYARQRDELVRTGWELAERLERERELVGDRVRMHERSRIAGDMHDSLGHELSMIALRAAALQVRQGLDEPARDAAGELRRAAAAATDRLREVIGVLREYGEGAPTRPAGDTVESLVESAAASGMAVTLADGLRPSGDGEPREAGDRGLPPAEDGDPRQAGDDRAAAPPMADRAIYRVVQEALTNAAKHAPGAAVTVTLRRDAADALVSVVNEAPPNGRAAAVPSERLPVVPNGPGGHGLVGLDERVRLAGGTLRARPVAGGFAVTARLPLGAGAAAAPPGTTTGTPGMATDSAGIAAASAGVAGGPPGGAGVSRHGLARARRQARRGMVDTIWLPLAMAAVLLLLIAGFDLDAPDRAVLDEEAYGRLRVGERQGAVETRLPVDQIGGGRPRHAPADPPGADDCRFYRTAPGSLSPAYRLCFTGGRLSHKDKPAIDD
jgi:signal transduction histidine kinase